MSFPHSSSTCAHRTSSSAPPSVFEIGGQHQQGKEDEGEEGQVVIVQFNGSLLKENAYRQRAGDAVDAVWEAMGVNC
jgi:hypothetical protein